MDARYRIASNYLSEEKFEEAVKEFKEILTQYPNSSYAPDAQFSLAKAFMAQEKYQDAVREFRQFIQYFPQNNQIAEARFLSGVCYFTVQSYLSAIDYFNEVIEQNPESEYYASSLQNAGWSSDRLKDYEKALDYFQKYLAAKPKAEDKTKIRLQMANEYSELNRAADAANLYSELAKAKDAAIGAEAAYQLGMLRLNQNQVAQAKTAFNLAIKNGASSDYYRLSSIAQLAAIYENSGEQQKAISAYKMLADSTTEARWVDAANQRIQALLAANKGN